MYKIKIGLRNTNNFGSEMVIAKYRNALDIDIYFPQYNWTFKGATYQSFKNGLIKCPYEPKVLGIGYIGEGKYKSKENGKNTRVYKTWKNMLQRCYDSKYHEEKPTYINCSVSEEFHNFQNFGEWDEYNFYQIEGQQMCLDKDILVKHNKLYSPDTCIYVPKTINSLFVKRQNDRGKSAIGTFCDKNGKYIVHCSLINPKNRKSKNEYLGTYDSQEKAFEIYKYYKEKNIKQVADYFKDEIPVKLYNALYNYEVEITD